MLCCAIGAAAIATGAISAPPLLRRLPGRGSVAVLGLALAGVAGFAGHHLDHFAARAALNGRGIMAEIRAAPICTGDPARGRPSVKLS